MEVDIITKNDLEQFKVELFDEMAKLLEVGNFEQLEYGSMPFKSNTLVWHKVYDQKTCWIDLISRN